MPEPKDTAARVADMKKRELDLVEARANLKQLIVTQIDELKTQLETLGFSYSLVERNGTPKKTGRPRKETVHGKEED